VFSLRQAQDTASATPQRTCPLREAATRELYQKLRAEPWIEPWLDEEELFPGMDWNLEIEKALGQS